MDENLSMSPMRDQLPLSRIVSEVMEQTKLIRWAAEKSIMLIAIPNGGKRTGMSGAILRNSGMRQGFPDLFMPEARGGYHGFFLEMKQNRTYTPSQRKTPTFLAQVAWQEYLLQRNYFARFAYGYEDAKRVVMSYLAFELSSREPWGAA